MKLNLIIATSLLASCAYTIDEWELRLVESGCKDHGGIDYILTSMPIAARCKDGAVTSTSTD